MAKNRDHIEMRDGRASLWYVDRKRPESWRPDPWGLRAPVAATSTEDEASRMTAADAFRAARADYPLSMSPIIHAGAEMDGYRIVTRQDTGAGIAVVGDRYQTVDGGRIARALDASGFRPDSVAVLNGAVRGYAQMIAAEDSVRAGDTGKVASFLSAMWSHDGTSEIVIGETRTGVVCINTYSKMQRELRKSGKGIRHAGDVDGALLDLELELATEREHRTAFLDAARRMASVNLPKSRAADLLSATFGAESAQARNTVAEILSILDAANPSTGVIGDGSVWDVYQSVTFRDSHSRTVKGTASDPGMADAVRRLRGPSESVASIWDALASYSADAAPVYQTVSVLS